MAIKPDSDLYADAVVIPRKASWAFVGTLIVALVIGTATYIRKDVKEETFREDTMRIHVELRDGVKEANVSRKEGDDNLLKEIRELKEDQKLTDGKLRQVLWILCTELKTVKCNPDGTIK